MYVVNLHLICYQTGLYLWCLLGRAMVDLAGKYQCVAVNSVGRAVKLFTLQVTGMPITLFCQQSPVPIHNEKLVFINSVFLIFFFVHKLAVECMMKLRSILYSEVEICISFIFISIKIFTVFI